MENIVDKAVKGVENCTQIVRIKHLIGVNDQGYVKAEATTGLIFMVAPADGLVAMVDENGKDAGMEPIYEGGILVGFKHREE